ncbi:DUF3078 domain-containing protein [Limibacter armeniacum]|uniref:DUF3078 domain-containing protein n=1 Tax=Limibacter armeniacum TaxID=466084 RepID=UPI002FE6C213
MKKYLHLMQYLAALAVFLIFTTSQASAQKYSQDSVWKYQGTFGINLSNVGLYQWAGGGSSSISAGALVDVQTVREGQKTVWTNKLRMAYGIIKQQNTEYEIRKTDDEFLFSTDYGYKFNKKWQVKAGMSLATQFNIGYEYKAADGDNNPESRNIISNFMSPGYLGVNLTGLYKPSEHINFSVSPLSNRITFVMDDTLSARGAFGVDPGEHVRYQVGFTFNNNIDVPLFKNTKFQSNFTLFSPYDNMDKWVANWGTLLVMKVNKFITTNFGTQLIYDPDVDVPRSDGTTGEGIQFKNVLNVGFTYSI